jgi:hypothetical protein
MRGEDALFILEIALVMNDINYYMSDIFDTIC